MSGPVRVCVCAPKRKFAPDQGQEARKIMLALLDKHIATIKNNAKDERELNKHLANIGNYTQGTL